MPPQQPGTQLTPDQFAQSVKAKYPAYANVDNATLTQKMLAKYPEYSNRVAPATPATPQTFTQKVEGGLKSFTDAVGFGKTVDTIGTQLAHVTASPKTAPYLPGASVKDLAGATLNVGSLLSPVGRLARLGTVGLSRVVGPTLAKVGGNMLAGAVPGLAMDVGQELENNQPIKPGLGTFLGAGLPVVGGVAGAAASKLKNVASNQAPRVINSLIKPLSKGFTYGKDPGRTVSELGIVGNTMEELASNVTKAKNSVGAQIGAIADSLPHGDQGIKISATEAVKPFDEAITKAINSNDQTLYNRLNEAKNAITQIFSTNNGKIVPVGSRVLENLSYKQALEYKQLLGNLTKWTGQRTEDETVNGALTRAYGTIKTGMNKAADQYSPEIATKMKKLNEQFGDLTSAEVATKYRDILQKRQNLVNLPGTLGLTASVLAAPFTGGVSTIIGAIASIGIDKALSSPAFKTRLAAWLARAGPAEKAALIKGAPQLAKFMSPGDMVADSVGKYLKKNPPSLGLSLKDVSGGAPAFKGFEDLSTKLVEKLKGRSVVSKQFIEDLTNSADMKQAEKDLVRTILKEQPEKINVTDFANKVKTELLPLQRNLPTDDYGKKIGTGGRNVADTANLGFRYENVSLPTELRGPVANYSEHVYNSPISTSAGGHHFSDSNKNYFAHTRIEDLPHDSYKAGEYAPAPGTKGTTRRVIELQSDLFQKGRLEGENTLSQEQLRAIKADEGSPGRSQTLIKGQWVDVNEAKQLQSAREAELKKLEPYRNTWHERLVREEVKQAALDGKTKLQFPTGETAMKIEGLGDNTTWFDSRGGQRGQRITPGQLKVGTELVQGADGSDWIITDVLDDGKFMAIPRSEIDSSEEKLVEMGYTYPDDAIEALAKGKKDIKDFIQNDIYSAQEQFDISGKVDTNNPIYKFYDKEVAKYLKNKYNAQLITDPQGVKWWEVSVKPEYKKLPIEAFGAGGLLLPKKDEKKLPAKPAKLN